MKTSELIGPALDWAVAKCEFPEPDYTSDDWIVYVTTYGDDDWIFNPSTDWSQGGPIIERERLFLTPQNYGYLAQSTTSDGRGETPLIAAMRCYVASKLGDEVDMPENLHG